MNAFFLIGAVAKRPRPVRERSIRKALLRAISRMYDDSRWATKGDARRPSAGGIPRAVMGDTPIMATYSQETWHRQTAIVISWPRGPSKPQAATAQSVAALAV